MPCRLMDVALNDDFMYSTRLCFRFLENAYELCCYPGVRSNNNKSSIGSLGNRTVCMVCESECVCMILILGSCTALFTAEWFYL